MEKGIINWNEHKRSIMRELAKLEGMNWIVDEQVAESIFPYVLVEAINILKNSKIVDDPHDYAKTSEGAKRLLEELVKEQGG